MIASIITASAAHAQTTIDITKISCQQFVNHEVDTEDIALWLAGYYAGKRGDTTVDLQLLRRRLQQLKDYCELNRGSLMGVAEKVLSSSEWALPIKAPVAIEGRLMALHVIPKSAAFGTTTDPFRKSV